MLQQLLRHPLAIILGSLLLGLGGLTSLRGLPVDLFPRLDYPLINVITHYPAGTAEDMEQLVTRPIENAMLGLTNLRRVRSTSAPAFSQVTIEFTWGMDVLQARQLVGNRLTSVSLPAGATPELKNIGTSLAMLSTYTLSGGDPVASRAFAQYQLAPRLAALPGVARIQVMGGGETAWRIDVDPLKLKRHHLSTADIIAAVNKDNVLDTGGYLEQYGRDLLIRTEGRLLTLEDLKQVMVRRLKNGQPLLLGDIASVYAGTKPQRYIITTDRLPAVAFTVQKQPGASTLAVSQAVDKTLQQITLPPNTTLEKFYDQAEIIGLAYRNMRNNLLIGTLLAILAVIWVLGRNRSSLVIAFSFPLVALATFAAMGSVDLGLNLMTLGALTVAIGLIDDDAIVVMENIDRHRSLGKPPLQAALDGTREVLAADVAGTMTVLAAFVPLVLVTGLAGRLFQPFGLTFGFVLLFSLLVSLTLIPLASVYWARHQTVAETPKSAGSRWIDWLGQWNLRLLDHLLQHRALTIVITVVLLLGSFALLALNPARMLPLLDEGSLLLSYQLAPGTSLSESNRVGDKLESQLLEMPAIKAVFRRTGSPESSFFIEGPDQGELVVRLDKSNAKDPLKVKAKIDHLLANTPGVIGRVNEPTSEKLDESFSGLPALFGITLFGNNLQQLYAAAGQVEQAARKVPGIANVVNNTKVPVDQIRIALDREALACFGVSVKTAAQAVRTAMQGDSIGQVIIEQQPVDIVLRYARNSRDNPKALGQVQIQSQTGKLIPLSQLATIEPLSSYPTIEHQHGLRALTLTAEIDGNPYSVLRRLEQTLHNLNLPADIQWSYTGEYGQLIKTGGQVLWVLLASALLVYGIIAIQLGNLLDPAVVLTKLPLDFMGAALALFITRQHLDLTVAIGFITLIGVATNNGIMLLTFTRNFRRQGLDAIAAVREAVRLRTRPMLLTHLTTLLALIPAALGLGQGPQLLQPLGIMLFGGLTAGTLLTLNLLPVIYVATERWRRIPDPA
ncbi:MAG: efflux RND transporter permease subunit [Thiotrichales bacterium]